ncbi:MAG: D-alanyl-D-alanine carboxypeptidase [Clostridiales bacterium]|nr:D-alanyl-D-alanine carboxypeptidase [Clostridiales bacterium]
MRKTLFSFMLTLSLLAAAIFGPLPAGPAAQGFEPTGFEVTAEGAMLVSLDTGGVLYQKNIDQRLYPASLTKIMTSVLLIENTVDLDAETITVSWEALHDLVGTDSSTAGLKEGEVLTARQLLYALLLASGNDGANATAEHYGGGNIERFVQMMNDKAAELGMSGTHYANPHGLHDENHYTTVEDMYKLVRHAISLPVFMEVASTVRYKLPATNKSPERTLVTTNYLQDPSNAVYYKGTSGVKTGYTDSAGRCLITTNSRDGYNYLCILMKCPVYNDRHQKIRQEFPESRNLYNWAYRNFAYKSLLSPAEPTGEVELELAWNKDHLTLLPESEFSAIIPKEADSSTIRTEIHLEKEKVDAPVEKGQVMGYATLIYAGEELGQVNLVASESVKRSTPLYLLRQLKNMTRTLWFQVIAGVLLLLLIAFIILRIVASRRRRRMRRVRNYRRF